MEAKRLRPGDVVGIVSPSHVAREEDYARYIQALEALGLRVKTAPNLYKATYGYLASEQERADDLNAMAGDPEVKLVLFGGGEGSNEVLPLLDYDTIRRNPKFYCSYSDGTTILNAIHGRTGLITHYGQSPGIFGDLRHYDYLHFFSHFMQGGDGLYRAGKWITLCQGVCEGVLSGGYTRNFAMMLGGDYLCLDPKQKYLLFLEDHEKFSDVGGVSSYLSHLEQRGFMEQVTGVLFGHYSVEPNADLLARLTRLGQKYQIPVAYCDDFGHGVHHAILPIGGYARMDAKGGTLELKSGTQAP
ncbi:MAG: LD-carboxypeptidase [Eubacteriales bacterium]|nr:LD-carboxypeptidase [Eubacteriales bacterium]